MSLKGDKYENLEEVRFRLESSVVLYDGDPVYINRVSLPEDAIEKGEVARVYFWELPLAERNRKETRKYLSSKKFDLTPFKMGYMNHGGQATFVSRTPVRQNKQGLAQGVTTFTNTKGKKSQDMGFNTMVASKGFVDMVKGVYPDFKVAGDLLDDPEVASVAVSRSFAFVIDHDLEALVMVHKGDRCGLALRHDKGIKIPPKFHFLREEMEECFIPIL